MPNSSPVRFGVSRAATQQVPTGRQRCWPSGAQQRPWYPTAPTVRVRCWPAAANSRRRLPNSCRAPPNSHDGEAVGWTIRKNRPPTDRAGTCRAAAGASRPWRRGLVVAVTVGDAGVHLADDLRALAVEVGAPPPVHRPRRQRHQQVQDRGGGTHRVDGMAAVTSIMRVHAILLARVEEVLRPLALTFARYELLMVLSFSRAGAMPMVKASARLQVHPTSITNATARLEGAGLVIRRPHPEDGRAALVEITPAGRRLATRATALLNAEVFESQACRSPSCGRSSRYCATYARGPATSQASPPRLRRYCPPTSKNTSVTCCNEQTRAASINTAKRFSPPVAQERVHTY